MVITISAASKGGQKTAARDATFSLVIGCRQVGASHNANLTNTCSRLKRYPVLHPISSSSSFASETQLPGTIMTFTAQPLNAPAEFFLTQLVSSRHRARDSEDRTRRPAAIPCRSLKRLSLRTRFDPPAFETTNQRMERSRSCDVRNHAR